MARLAGSLLVGDGDGAVNIQLGGGLAEFTGRIAAADRVLIAGKAGDMVESVKLLVAALMEGLEPGGAEKGEPGLGQRVEVLLFGVGRKCRRLGGEPLGAGLHIAVIGGLLLGVHGPVRDARLEFHGLSSGGVLLRRTGPDAGCGTAELAGTAAGGGAAVIINRAFDRLGRAENGGAVLEEMGEWKDCCAFVFSDMPGSFLRDVYWWMAEHGGGEELYARYSVLEHVDAENATVSALREKTRLDILIDDTHPVLLLQLAPTSSLAPVTEALASACGGEGWTLCVK